MKKSLTFYSIIIMFFFILQRVAGFLTKIVMANSITPYEYGIISLVAISLPGMFQLVTNLNFFQILSHSEEGKKYFGFTIICSLLIVIISSILLVIFSADFFNYLNLPQSNSELFLVAMIISMLSISIIIDFQGLFTGLKLYSTPSFVMAIPTFIRLIMVSILMLIHVTSLQIYILVFALSNAVPFLYIAFSKPAKEALHYIKIINIPSKKIFAFGISIFIANNFSQIGQYLIKLNVSHELGITWQGYYDISHTLAMVMIFALGTMAFITVPEATNPDKQSIYRKGGLGDITRALFAFIIFLAVILFFYSHFFVEKIFSIDFMPASNYVYILAIGYVFFFIQNYLSYIHFSQAKSGKEYIVLTVIPICLLPLFFILTTFLISIFRDYGFGNGFIGAYVSFTTLIIIYTVLTIYCCRDLTPLKMLLKKIDRLLISILIPSIIVYYFNPTPLVGMCILMVSCSILVFFTGYLKLDLFSEL